MINNVTGAIISEDVTMSGESPTVGPFTQNEGVFPSGLLTALDIRDSVLHDELLLQFLTPVLGSLVGYNGGPLSTQTSVTDFAIGAIWSLTSGSLTLAVTAPEPSSVALMLLGVGLVFVMRKRIGQRLPQAS